ncbi:MAG: histidinol dehydrogenase [Nitrospirae bacterium]|nr:MAG: histidinol dehydrogenase [Nitrospirota bacterium]
MRVIAASDRAFKAAVKKVVSRTNFHGGKIESAVRTILKSVERGGDTAVSRYTKKFDKVRIKPGEFRISPEQVREAYYKIRKEDGDALRYAAHRIMAFHEREKPRARTWMYQDGTITLGQAILPLDSVGLYVPGGKAVYPSSVLMSAIPAKVAGVKRVVMCTPATKGELSPYLLVAADIAGVDEVYRIGGVQAIGAMTYGTKSIPRVDKIIGPGNIYVATAKRLMYGLVDIDMIAGPSELLVLADAHANPSHVAADLLCEAEHDENASVWLVTTSAPLAKEAVRRVQEQLKFLGRKKVAARSIQRNAMAFVVPTVDDGIALANEIAPEHLSLSVENPFEYIEKVRHAGALFIGRYTAPAVADYVAGPNHILPTGGTARFHSALSLDAYVRKSNIVSYTKDDLFKAKDHILRLAQMEGFDAHAQSVEVRLK